MGLTAILLAACEGENRSPGSGPNNTSLEFRDPNGSVAAVATFAMIGSDPASGQRWHSDSTREGRGDTRFVAYEPAAVKPASWPADLFFIPDVEIVTHTRPGALPGFHLVAKTQAQADSVANVVVGKLRADGWTEIAPNGGPPRARARAFSKGTHTYAIYQLGTVVQLTGVGSDGA